jgi:hypothetical protein
MAFQRLWGTQVPLKKTGVYGKQINAPNDRPASNTPFGENKPAPAYSWKISQAADTAHR